MAASDMSALIRAAALAAIDRQCLGEDYTFDVALQVTTGEHRPVTAYVLVITRKSALLGKGPLCNISTLGSAAPSAEQVEAAVGAAITSLRQMARRQLAGQNGAAAH